MAKRGGSMAGAMARLWAPWRMAYIKEAEKGEACFLCGLPKQKKDRENLILKRGKSCFVILNKYPYNNGHLLVAPYRHVADIEKLTNAESLELMRLTGRAKVALDRAMKPHGYNVGVNLGRAAGAGLPGHVHLHVVPRWNGDTNFMPLLGDTKVLPLTLAESWEMLARRLR
ncbi:MAG: hit family [Planctomycetota bacterium]|nr:MAG: hit family [Planctomycetota bacterium]